MQSAIHFRCKTHFDRAGGGAICQYVVWRCRFDGARGGRRPRGLALVQGGIGIGMCMDIDIAIDIDIGMDIGVGFLVLLIFAYRLYCSCVFASSSAPTASPGAVVFHSQ